MGTQKDLRVTLVSTFNDCARKDGSANGSEKKEEGNQPAEEPGAKCLPKTSKRLVARSMPAWSSEKSERCSPF